jgi:voltage-gated potassium channel
MKSVAALIFGHNEYGYEIAKNVEHVYNDITIFKIESNDTKLFNHNYNIEKFDLSEEWDELENKYDMSKSVAFCVLEDDAQNIFLTISLRATFKDLIIVALSKNKESAHKLSMAGANKVIPMVQTTSDIISDMLQKPIVTEVLHKILYEESALKIAQIKVNCNSRFDGKYPSDIEWSREHGIIVLSVIHEDMSSEFIYSSKAKHHIIKEGDIFVVVGYDSEIKEFEKYIGGEQCKSE